MLVPVSFLNLLQDKDCPFVIKVRVDGQKLCIKEISGEHNHELSEVRIIVNVVMDYHNYNSYFIICRNEDILILKQNKKL